MRNSINLNLHLMNADKQLKPHLREIKKIMEPLLKQLRSLLPLRDSVDIIVYRYHTNEKAFAVSGYCPTGNTLWIYTDPSFKSYRKLLEQQLPRPLVHEMHHIARWQGPGYGSTLLEAMVSEGLAGHFETEVLGGKPSRFYVKFTKGEIQKLLIRARKEFNKRTYNHSDWFFGNKKLKIPRHAGYGLGYYLTADMVRKEGAGKLAQVRVGQIVQGSVSSAGKV